MTTPPPGQPGDNPYGQQSPNSGETQPLPSYGQAQPVSGDPYSTPGNDPQAKSGRPTWFWVVGIIAAIVLLCCCGGAAVAGWSVYNDEASPLNPTETSSSSSSSSSSSTSTSPSSSSSTSSSSPTSSSSSTAAPTNPDVPAPPEGSTPNTNSKHKLPTEDLKSHAERALGSQISSVFCPSKLTLVEGETTTCVATSPDDSERFDVGVEVEWAAFTDEGLQFYLHFARKP